MSLHLIKALIFSMYRVKPAPNHKIECKIPEDNAVHHQGLHYKTSNLLDEMIKAQCHLFMQVDIKYPEHRFEEI